MKGKKTLIALMLILLINGCAIVSGDASVLAANLSIKTNIDEIQVMEGQTQKIKLLVNPATIEAGESCGMDDMCGVDPCICGSADQWGYCSCNGLKEIYPIINITSSDNNTARAKYSEGRVVIKGIKRGTATININASLRHHNDSKHKITVRVVPLSPIYHVLAVLVGTVIMLTVVWAGINIKRKCF